MEAPRRDPSGPVDSAEWLVDLCTSASLQIRREQSQSDPNASACHDDLDPAALASGVLDAFFALQDSLASLLVDPDAVREVLGRGGELLRLTRGDVAEACRRSRGREVEGPAYGHRRIGSDGNASCANGDSSSCGHGSPGRRPTSDSCNATESRTSQPPRQNSSNIDGNLSSNSGVSSLVSQTSFRRSPLVGMKLNSFVIKLNVVSSVSLVKIPT